MYVIKIQSKEALINTAFCVISYNVVLYFKPS